MLVVQTGQGRTPDVPPHSVEAMHMNLYHFKPSLKEDMQRASLVISHGGAVYTHLYLHDLVTY